MSDITITIDRHGHPEQVHVKSMGEFRKMCKKMRGLHIPAYTNLRVSSIRKGGVLVPIKEWPSWMK